MAYNGLSVDDVQHQNHTTTAITYSQSLTLPTKPQNPNQSLVLDVAQPEATGGSEASTLC